MLSTFCHLIYIRNKKKEKETSKRKRKRRKGNIKKKGTRRTILIINGNKSNVETRLSQEHCMDHTHTNYFLPFDAATYFDAAAAASYNPYTDFYSHQQTGTNPSTSTPSYHQMYRTAPTTLRHPSSFYSATMQSK